MYIQFVYEPSLRIQVYTCVTLLWCKQVCERQVVCMLTPRPCYLYAVCIQQFKKTKNNGTSRRLSTCRAHFRVRLLFSQAQTPCTLTTEHNHYTQYLQHNYTHIYTSSSVLTLVISQDVVRGFVWYAQHLTSKDGITQTTAKITVKTSSDVTAHHILKTYVYANTSN